MIFDTNVLIYISQNILKIENLIEPKIKPGISVISYVEALGFSFSTPEERFYMEQICNSCQTVNLSEQIIKETIRLKSNFKIKLPDAIIYATAVIEELPLMTNNISDFKSLDGGVKLINPFTL